jgi:hypothetical protein
MNVFDEKGNVSPPLIWAAAATLFGLSLPVIWLYASYGYQLEGVFSCLSTSILVIYALQFPKYLKRPWLYAYIAVLTLFYMWAALLLPGSLPKGAPTSAFLWPLAFVTIGIDFVMLRIFVKVFEK